MGGQGIDPLLAVGGRCEGTGTPELYGLCCGVKMGAGNGNVGWELDGAKALGSADIELNDPMCGIGCCDVEPDCDIEPKGTAVAPAASNYERGALSVAGEDSRKKTLSGRSLMSPSAASAIVTSSQKAPAVAPAASN
jgi:hypothetical protein